MINRSFKSQTRTGFFPNAAGNLLITILIGIFILVGCQSPAGGALQKDQISSGTVSETDSTSNDVITAPPEELGLDTFYKKYLNASGIPIISSDNVPDEAFFAVRRTVNEMMSMRKDVLAKMIENKIRVGIMAKSEVTKDMPEYRTLEEDNSGRYWNDDRGIGATIDRPLSSCAEENVLCYGKGNDPYYSEDILIHEFAHSVHELGILFVDPNFNTELKQAFDDAKAKGLWLNTYAGSNPYEYFAEGVQDWFNLNAESIPSNGIHNEINTREELKEYDPLLYEIIKRYFPENYKKISCHQ